MNIHFEILRDRFVGVRRFYLASRESGMCTHTCMPTNTFSAHSGQTASSAQPSVQKKGALSTLVCQSAEAQRSCAGRGLASRGSMGMGCPSDGAGGCSGTPASRA